MNFSQVYLIFIISVALSTAKIVKIRNARSTALSVSVGGVELSLAANTLIPVNLPEEWSGAISAAPIDSELTNGPKTHVNLSLSTAGDSYSVSLLSGFNLPVKVVPNGSTYCLSTVCAANILQVCPVAQQVLNSLGEVVACENSPLVMSRLCPLAVVDELSSTINVQQCNTAEGYMIIFL